METTKTLSRYNFVDNIKGISIIVNTPDCEYKISTEQGNRLVNAISTPNPPKFVQLQTTSGNIVLNTSSIMSIKADTDKVSAVMSLLDNNCKLSFVNASLKTLELPSLTNDEFEYYKNNKATIVKYLGENNETN